MSNFRQPFFQNLRAVRKSANLTQADMAQELSLTRSAYAYYELGRVQPSLNTLVKICGILGVSSDSLLGLG